MINVEDLAGKKVEDIIDNDTKILTKFMDGYNVKEAVFKKGNLSIVSKDNLSVMSDYQNHLVFCIKEDKVIALFHVYDIYDVSFNAEKKMVTAVGHETNHQYWFDDGSYDCQHTR